MGFKCVLTAMRASSVGSQKVRRGGKVLLPEAVMHSLMIAGVDYPMLFKISSQVSSTQEHSDNKVRHIYCGVLEFTAQSSTIVLPDWMMEFLGTDVSPDLIVESVSLPLGGYVKIRALEECFLHLHNPKAVLEHNLADFSALTKGATIEIYHNNQAYHISVCDIRAQKEDPRTDPDGICIIDVDVILDIDHPSFECSQRSSDVKANLSFQQVNSHTEAVLHGGPQCNEKAKNFIAFTGSGKSVSGIKDMSAHKNIKMTQERYASRNDVYIPFGGEGRVLKKE